MWVWQFITENSNELITFLSDKKKLKCNKETGGLTRSACILENQLCNTKSVLVNMRLVVFQYEGTKTSLHLKRKG